MGLQFEEIWRSLLRGGPRIALLTFGSALAFAVINKLADNAMTNGIDYLSAIVRPPTFLLVFSDPVNPVGLELLKDGRAKQANKTETLGDRALKVTTSPGYYILKVYRDRSDGRYALSAPLNLRPANSDYQVDASENHWALEQEITHFKGTNLDAPPNLIGTRWITSQADWETVASAPTEKLASIVKTALEQVGVNAKGSEVDKQTIVGFFSQTNVPSPSQVTPWGGAFLNWVMRKSGAPTPGSASFTAWLTWGEPVSMDKSAAGMVVIFDFPGLTQAPSGLLVGIMTRRKSDCIEVVVGNIADRVVITCVSGSVKSIRKPAAT